MAQTDSPAAIGKRLREWGLSKFPSLKGLADALGIPQSMLSNYLAGDRRPGNEMQAKLRALDCDIEWLMTGRKAGGAGSDDSHDMASFAPFLGRIVADPKGKEYFDDEGIPKGAGVPFFKGNFFCLEVENDSLISAEPISIYPYDICVFEANRQPKNGDIVAVHLDGDKRLVKILKHLSRDEVELSSANKFRNYPSITLKKDQIKSFGVFVTKLQITEAMKKRFGLKK